MREEIPEKPAVISYRLDCAGCGYNLEGLPDEGVCPECGFSVALSRRGTQLRYRSAEYLERLQRGAGLCCISLLVAFGLGLIGTVSGFFPLIWSLTSTNGAPPAGITAIPGIISLAGIGVAGFGAWATWVFTTPDPGGTPPYGETSRKTARVSSICELCLQIMAGPLAFFVTTSAFAIPGGAAGGAGPAPTLGIALIASLLISLLSTAAMATRFFSTILYIKTLARRMEAYTIVQQTGFRIWFIPICFTVGTLLCYTGPIVGFVLYYMLFSDTRKSLGDVIALNAGEAHSGSLASP